MPVSSEMQSEMMISTNFSVEVLVVAFIAFAAARKLTYCPDKLPA